MKRLITYVIILLVFTSCVTTRERDQRAVNRVKANIILLDDVFMAGLKLHPCANSGTTVIHKDTTITYDTIKPKPVPGPLKPCIPDTIRIKSVKTILVRKDSTIVDNLRIDILTDSVNVGKQKLAFKQGQVYELQGQIGAFKKVKTKLWLVIAGLGLVIGLLIYLKIKV
jgi:hypothetical protein